MVRPSDDDMFDDRSTSGDGEVLAPTCDTPVSVVGQAMQRVLQENADKVADLRAGYSWRTRALIAEALAQELLTNPIPPNIRLSLHRGDEGNYLLVISITQDKDDAFTMTKIFQNAELCLNYIVDYCHSRKPNSVALDAFDDRGK